MSANARAIVHATVCYNALGASAPCAPMAPVAAGALSAPGTIRAPGATSA